MARLADRFGFLDSTQSVFNRATEAMRQATSKEGFDKGQSRFRPCGLFPAAGGGRLWHSNRVPVFLRVVAFRFPCPGPSSGGVVRKITAVAGVRAKAIFGFSPEKRRSLAVHERRLVNFTGHEPGTNCKLSRFAFQLQQGDQAPTTRERYAPKIARGEKADQGPHQAGSAGIQSPGPPIRFRADGAA